MALIKLRVEQPGIIGLLASFPESGRILSELAEHLLRSDKYAMPTYAREMIASFVSSINKVDFCKESHAAAAIALAHKEGIEELHQNSEVGSKYLPLLQYAGVIADFDQDPKLRKEALVSTAVQAKLAGFTEEDILLTCLIASAFCMYNRYVDGLVTDYSHDFEDYIDTGVRLAEKGYLASEPSFQANQPIVEEKEHIET